jgi:hypothetical protein
LFLELDHVAFRQAGVKAGVALSGQKVSCHPGGHANCVWIWRMTPKAASAPAGALTRAMRTLAPRDAGCGHTGTWE